jgi:hypothetical protein
MTYGRRGSEPASCKRTRVGPSPWTPQHRDRSPAAAGAGLASAMACLAAHQPIGGCSCAVGGRPACRRPPDRAERRLRSVACRNAHQSSPTCHTIPSLARAHVGRGTGGQRAVTPWRRRSFGQCFRLVIAVTSHVDICRSSIQTSRYPPWKEREFERRRASSQHSPPSPLCPPRAVAREVLPRRRPRAPCSPGRARQTPFVSTSCPPDLVNCRRRACSCSGHHRTSARRRKW